MKVGVLLSLNRFYHVNYNTINLHNIMYNNLSGDSS